MTATAHELTLEWFGCTTFRLQTAGLTLLLDAYLDKAPGVEPAGLDASAVPVCDWILVTHAHFDHMIDAGQIALETGATVVGNPEVTSVLRTQGVPEAQLVTVTGGETVHCGDDITVRVLPGLHSCLFAAAQVDTAEPATCDLGVSAQQRHQAAAAIFDLLPQLSPEVGVWFERTSAYCSTLDGGQLMYVLDTPAGRVLLSGSSGHWTGIIDGLKPDLALLALAGRPHIDGEPHQGSLADFLSEQVRLLQPGTVALCHHDALLPPIVQAVDTTAALARLTSDHADVALLELPLLTLVTWTARGASQHGR